MLDQAAALAVETGEMQRIVPVAVARAEAAWTAGTLTTCVAELRSILTFAINRRPVRPSSEVAYWLWKAGALTAPPPDCEEAYAAQIEGRWREAAELWQAMGCPFEWALALAEGDEAAVRESFVILESLGAAATLATLRERLRTAGMRGLPRGPRATTVANAAGLTNARWMCCCCSRKVCRTQRSHATSSAPSAPSIITSHRF